MFLKKMVNKAYYYYYHFTPFTIHGFTIYSTKHISVMVGNCNMALKRRMNFGLYFPAIMAYTCTILHCNEFFQRPCVSCLTMLASLGFTEAVGEANG